MTLTNRGKALIMLTATLFAVFLGYKVITDSPAPKCERLYNEYTSASDMGERANIFEEGMQNGCFHYN